MKKQLSTRDEDAGRNANFWFAMCLYDEESDFFQREEYYMKSHHQGDSSQVVQSGPSVSERGWATLSGYYTFCLDYLAKND